MLGKVEGRRRGDGREWDGWIASLTGWTWVWVSSWSWWWTGNPGVLQSMGLQRVRHNWVTALNWKKDKHMKLTLGEMIIENDASGKEPACQCMRHKWHGFDPWVGKIHWRRAWQPIPVFLPGGLQSIASQRVGYGWVTEEAWIVLVGAISKILWEQTRKETQRSLELAQKHRAWKEGVEGPTINQLSPSVSAFYFPFLVTPYLRNISHSFSKWDSVMQKTQWQCRVGFLTAG